MAMLAPRMGPFRTLREKKWGQNTAQMEGNTFRILSTPQEEPPASWFCGLSALKGLPCCWRGTHRGPTHPRGPLCVTHSTVTICLLFVPPLPLFNCWMSLQSCVPKTINSREQSYTKKGVAPEGDDIHGNHHLFTAA